MHVSYSWLTLSFHRAGVLCGELHTSQFTKCSSVMFSVWKESGLRNLRLMGVDPLSGIFLINEKQDIYLSELQLNLSKSEPCHRVRSPSQLRSCGPIPSGLRVFFTHKLKVKVMVQTGECPSTTSIRGQDGDSVLLNKQRPFKFSNVNHTPFAFYHVLLIRYQALL